MRRDIDKQRRANAANIFTSGSYNDDIYSLSQSPRVLMHGERAHNQRLAWATCWTIYIACARVAALERKLLHAYTSRKIVSSSELFFFPRCVYCDFWKLVATADVELYIISREKSSSAIFFFVLIVRETV